MGPFLLHPACRIWAVSGHQSCVRKDFEGTWVSAAGLTSTISDVLTGTFHSTECWEWTGELAPIAPTSGDLREVHDDCTAADVCADDSYLIVIKYYFSQGDEHCATVRANLEVDLGEHGHLSLSIDGPHKSSATGDITG